MEKITGVNVALQRDERIYSFVLTGDQVLQLCRVERFGEDVEGVNRQFDQKHAEEIMAAMANGKSLWLEPILGDLRSGWKYKDGELRYDEDDYISIDDGQHRWGALKMLNAEERDHLSFTINATMNLSFNQRLEIFRMQMHRKQIDARLDLAQRHKLGDWKSPIDREAYELVLKLQSDQASPLRGKILLNEQVKRPYEARHRPTGINAKGMVVTLRSVLGGRSPLHVLSADRRAQVVITMISLAADIWPNAWESDQHVLTTARGINAILSLLLSSPNFRAQVGNDFTQESLRKGLQLAKSFQWSVTKNKNDGVNKIVDRLDQAIGRNHQAAARDAA
ncbi:MAG: hypothetical protein V4674_01090 [Patescibacteria group bacterium]